MHIQLRQNVFLFRNIKICESVQLFIEKKIQKTETKTNGADSRPTVTLPYLQVQMLVLSLLRCSGR